jgi:uncharacterized damage-inducible protein DinB
LTISRQDSKVLSTMPGRPHAERILADLNEIRCELVAEVAKIRPNQLDWVPSTGMKSYRDILIEIGSTEAENLSAIKTGKVDGKAAAAYMNGKGPDVQSVLADLDRVRQDTIDFLKSATEDDLQQPAPLPPEWYQFFDGKTEIEPEELLRWTARHEYYHLGQIITMRWLQGHNPYQSAD